MYFYPAGAMNDIDDVNFDLIIIHDVTNSNSNQSRTTKREQIEKEIDKFLSEKTSTNVCETLNDFPNIKKVFMKYNCIRSSEAICERLFSYAG